MKRRVLSTAAALAVLAPTAAFAETTGFVQGALQSSEAEVAGVSFDDGEAWGLRGTIAWVEPAGIGLQVDGAYGEAEDELESWSLGSHVFVRQGNYLVGAFAGYGEGDVGAPEPVGYWSAGVEGQWYFDRTTLGAAIAYTTDDEDIDLSLTSLELGVTHFFTDHLSVNANAALGALDDGVDSVDARRFGVGAEFQLSSIPLSVFGSYNHLDVDDIDTEIDLLRVGVRYDWSGSLLERNRRGPLVRDAGAVSLLEAAPQ